MPLYEYECEACGVFESFQPVSKAGHRVACPECEAMSARSWSVPSTRVMSPLGRMAAERNEKSRHAPHVCKSGCGCGSKRKSSAKSPGPGKLQAYTGARPWVIEHG